MLVYFPCAQDALGQPPTYTWGTRETQFDAEDLSSGIKIVTICENISLFWKFHLVLCQHQTVWHRMLVSYRVEMHMHTCASLEACAMADHSWEVLTAGLG